MTTTTLFAPIVNKTVEDDGTLTVYGKLTGPDLDFDGQIADPAWLKTAVPEWFEIGNIREMHQPKAVGKATDLEQFGDDYYISAKIVDPTSIAKVEHGVLTGFSIGIAGPKITKDAAAPGGRIVGGDIIESSLADRPANETCKLVLAKSAGADLVQVEELVEVLAKSPGETIGVSGSVGDETELDPAADADEDASEETAEGDLIDQARAALIELLGGEVDELDDGGGLGPIRALVSLLEDLSWFAEIDAYDDVQQAVAAMKSALTTPIEETPVELSTIATLVKAATATDASDTDKATYAELRKALGVDELTEAATKTADATKEALAGLEARLVKVEETPAGVLPVLATGNGANQRELDPRLSDIARLEKAAANVDSPALAEGYRLRAAALRDELDPPTN